MLLITGGLGYIGSHTVVSLIQAGYSCVIIDNLSNSSREIHKTLESLTKNSIPLVIGDILDQQALQNIFDEYDIEGVIHFAGFKAVGESCKHPFDYYRNNIQGTENLLQVMLANGCKKLIFSSSATVYDINASKPPFNESSPTGNTSNPYGTTKFIIEQIIRDLTLHQGLQAIILRYFNPIGAHPSGKLGENPNNEPANLFPYIFKVLSGEREKVTIFGNDYDTRDGTGERDYIDIMDLVGGHIQSRKYLAKQNDKFYDIFNLGTGRGVTVKEAIQIIEEVTTHIISKDIGARRLGDVAISIADPSKAHKILKREASTPIQDSIRNTQKYIQNQKNDSNK